MKIGVLYNGLRGLNVLKALPDAQGFGAETDARSAKFTKICSYFDLMICAGWSQILKPDTLNAPRHGWWNCHAGPVPKYRGGSPLNWQIINDEDFIGITLLKMDEGIDTGPVISEAKFLRDGDNISQVHEKVNALFPMLVTNALEDFDHLNPRPQPESVSYFKQRSDEDGEIDLDWDARRIKCFVDALSRPYPGAYIRTSDGKKLRVWEVSYD